MLDTAWWMLMPDSLELPERQPITDSNNNPLPWFANYLRDVVAEVKANSETLAAQAQASADSAAAAASTAQTSATTAQTSATAAATAAANAAQSSVYLEYPNGKQVQWFDAGSGYPAGDPTRDFTITARDNAGNQIATMVVRGALATATGLITLSVQSESASTGHTIDEVFTGSGTASAIATITVTLPDSSKTEGVLSWTSDDISVGGEFINY